MVLIYDNNSKLQKEKDNYKKKLKTKLFSYYIIKSQMQTK